MSGFWRGLMCIFGVAGILAATPAGAQENLDSGKTPAQLFASVCAICHKSPQGLAKSGGVLGLESFLREHYTASRESAAAIANYLKAVGGPPAAPDRARATKRPAKGDDKSKRTEKKPGETKSSEPKPSEPKPSEAKPPEAKPSEPKALGAKPAEPKATAPKPSEPKVDGAPPTMGGRPD